jgi:hypothetical protein
MRIHPSHNSMQLDTEKHWVLVLNKYQRDNLLFLLELVNSVGEKVEPFHVMNTGDWNGEIMWMLGKRKHSMYASENEIVCQLDDKDQPNQTKEYIRSRVRDWLKETYGIDTDAGKTT